jgi:hypothetical protein
VALVGAVLFALGLLGVAEPPRYTPQDLHAEAKPSPLTPIGLFLLVVGGLEGYTAHLISRH